MTNLNILASTLSMDYADLKEYRYQSTRTTRAIYSIGNDNFCVGKTRPNDGAVWRKYSDQFFAKPQNTVVWISTDD